MRLSTKGRYAVMAMTDLPDTEATMRSHSGLAELTAEI